MQRFFLAPTLLALMAAGAVAQTAQQSIEVRGAQAVRTDARTLCPAIDSELHDALVKTVQDVAAAAVIDVRFQLAGNRIDGVITGAGPLRYQRALKRAVRGLECNGGQAAPQTVALRVRFVDPFARGSERAVALVTDPAPTR